jgi:hypothetical protein
MLLGLVRRETIFTPRAFRWVDTIIGASLLTALLAFGIGVHLVLGNIPSPSDGMEIIGAIGMAIVGTGAALAFAMLMVIIRSLLHKATDLQSAATTAA